MNVIVLDTETANSLDDPIAYDVGWAVIDLDSRETLVTRSYAVAEIFMDAELMSSAYYASKIPTYWEEIRNGSRALARLATVRKALADDCKAYEVTEIYAHNARFDNKSCNTSQRYLTGSKWRYFFPYGVTICDTLKMARRTFKQDDDYGRFCYENNYLTKRGCRRYTAEILYRYLTGDNNFAEAHRGLDDVLIEKEILFACIDRGVTEGRLWED